MPAQTTTPPRARARRAAGTSAPTGAKMIAASSSSGPGSSDGPAHSQPSSSANAAASSSPGRTKPNTRRPEAVEAEPLGIAGEAKRAVADQAGAEQRRGLEIVVLVGDRKAVALVGD